MNYWNRRTFLARASRSAGRVRSEHRVQAWMLSQIRPQGKLNSLVRRAAENNLPAGRYSQADRDGLGRPSYIELGKLFPAARLTSHDIEFGASR